MDLLKNVSRTRCSERVKTRSRAASKSRTPCTIRSFRLSSSIVIGERLTGLIAAAFPEDKALLLPLVLPEVADCP